MHYLTNYYRNLSEQLQEKVNFLEAQLNEYQVRHGEKDGKKGIFYGDKFVPDLRTETKPKKPGIPMFPERKPSILSPDGKPSTDSGPLLKKFPVDKKPARPGIPMFPEREIYRTKEVERPGDSNLIGKVPMSVDPDLLNAIPKRSNDELNVMPEPDRDEINIMPEFGQRGPVRPYRPYDFLRKDSKSKLPKSNIPKKEPMYYEGSDNMLHQSEVDDEGKPTGLVRATPKKLKIKKFGDSGPKIRPAPRERPSMG